MTKVSHNLLGDGAVGSNNFQTGAVNHAAIGTGVVTGGTGGNIAIATITPSNIANLSATTGNLATWDQIIAAIESRLCPIGGIIEYSGSAATLSANYPNWRVCDGTNGTPDLRNKFIMGSDIASIGQTGGASTVTPITSIAGSHSHGGATAAAGTHSHGGATLGHSLTEAEMAPHAHGVYIGSSTGSATGLLGANNVGTRYDIVQPAGSGAAHTHPLAPDGSHAHSVGADGNHAHTVSVSVLPPYYKLAKIIRIS